MVPCCCSKLSEVVPVDTPSLVTMATGADSTTTKTTLLDSTRSSDVISPAFSSSLSSSISPYSNPSPLHHGLTVLSTDYDLFQSIGIGCYGVAIINLARHKPSRTVCVVRQLDLEAFNTEKLEEIQHEMKMSSLLSHPNVLSYYCCFVSGSSLWAIQPLMHYGSCADLMHSAKQFNTGFQESVIAIILRDIVRGLHYIHSLGYVHRSIRAKHFLIHESGVVKLSGIRSLVPMVEGGARRKALHGHFSGAGDNICWLAPEVLAQDIAGYTYKSDIYSIGIAALELATGEAPFAGLPLTEIMMLKLRGHPPMLLRRQDDEDPIQHFSKTFFKVVDICVDPNPQHRPNTTKLLSLAFLKSRKKSQSLPSLKELLLPVVPLNTDQLNTPPQTDSATNVAPAVAPVNISIPIDPPFSALTLDEPWLI